MDPPATFDAILAVAIAALFGTAIGAEREWRRHPGGLRSCALVAAAASVFAQLAVTYAKGSQVAALGAIASGVGFIGAGVILHGATQVRGLSTAATFRAVAAVGTASGLREYALAVTLTVVVFFAHVALRSLSAWIAQKAPLEDPGPANPPNAPQHKAPQAPNTHDPRIICPVARISVTSVPSQNSGYQADSQPPPPR
jgi:putative Mg2+ transporter-C (MgtC) family protein